jgi:hypothetical protein
MKRRDVLRLLAGAMMTVPRGAFRGRHERRQQQCDDLWRDVDDDVKAHDPFEAELAGVAEYDITRLVNVVIEVKGPGRTA